MNQTSSSSLSLLLSGFKSESDEEGQIIPENEMNPQLMTINMHLSPLQLGKFLEYYTKKTDDQGFKYTKTQLNKINIITHNHLHIISKDLKTFKLYKAFIQIVTQDMNLWIDKDYHCSDVVLEILKEVQFNKDIPKFGKLLNKLRIDEILNRLKEKAEHFRKIAENDRKEHKRLKNYEKKQKKNLKVDPFDYLQLPVKRPPETLNLLTKSFETQNDLTFEFKKPSFDEENNFFISEIKNNSFDEKESFSEFSVPKFFENDFENPQKTNEKNVNFEEKTEDSKGKTEDSKGKTEDSKGKTENFEEKKSSKEIFLITKNYQTEEWFSPNNFEIQNPEIPEQRKTTKLVDPRLEGLIRCKGLDWILSNSSFASHIEKVTIIINLKCLVSLLCMKSIKNSNIQIPKDSMQIQLKNEKFLLSFRPGTKDFFTSLERFANIFIYSELTEEASKMIFADKKFVFSKDLSKFPDESLIIFDNSSYNWNPVFLVPLFYYTPFKTTSFAFTHVSLPRIPIHDHLKFANSCIDGQLKHLTFALENIFHSLIQHKYEKFFIWEYYQYCSSLLEGLQIGVNNYAKKIGKEGYTKHKLNVYFTVAKLLGAKIQENNSRQLVEIKTNEQEIPGTWLLSCFWNRCVTNEF